METYPSALIPFISTDEARPYSAPIKTPVGWQATNGHSLAWNHLTHVSVPAGPHYIGGPNNLETAVTIDNLNLGNAPHKWTCCLGLDVQKVVKWCRAWPKNLRANLLFKMNELPSVTVLRDIPKQQRRVGDDEFHTLVSFGTSPNLTEMMGTLGSSFTKPKGISVFYLADALEYAGGFVFCDPHDNESPWVFSPHACSIGSDVSWKDLFAPKIGCVVMPVKV